MTGQTNASISKYSQNLEFKKFNDKLFVKVYYHDTSIGYWPSDLSICNYNLEEKRFSILQHIPDLTYEKGIYEYVLEYPDVPQYNNQWSQTSLPWMLTNARATNYTAISINAAGSSSEPFGGISLSSSGSCKYDCQVGSSWWFALCSYSVYQGGVPGPCPSNTVVTKIALWLRYQ